MLRLLVIPGSAAAASFLLCGNAAASPPPADVPPSLEIPVAPAPASQRAARSSSKATPALPPLLAVDHDPIEPRPGAPEAMPPAPPAPKVVLLDEEPFKAGTARAVDDAQAHPHHPPKHGRHGRPYHPAPGIVVDVSGAHGGPGEAELQRDARNVGYWPFRHCYEEGLRRDQKLSGSVSVALGRRAGTVGAQLISSTVHDESVTLCVVREARGLDLPWGEGHGDSTADLKVTLSTGDAPVPVPKAVPHADEIRQALRASWPQVEQCYASDLSRRPDAGGRLTLRFRTKADGEILEVSEDTSRFADVDVTKCILGVYRTSSLPKIHGAHGGDFDYALHFEAAPAPPSATASR